MAQQQAAADQTGVVVDGRVMWGVKEVTAVRLRGDRIKRMEFETRWESGHTTWEPLESFEEGDSGPAIMAFRDRHLAEYNAVYEVYWESLNMRVARRWEYESKEEVKSVFNDKSVFKEEKKNKVYEDTKIEGRITRQRMKELESKV